MAMLVTVLLTGWIIFKNKLEAWIIYFIPINVEGDNDGVDVLTFQHPKFHYETQKYNEKSY